MRTRMYGGVRGRKTKIGGKPTFVFLLLDFIFPDYSLFFLQNMNSPTLIAMYDTNTTRIMRDQLSLRMSTRMHATNAANAKTLLCL